MDYMAIAVAIACATFWYKGAEMESIPPIYWAGPSVLLSGFLMLGLQRGWLTLLLAQVAMLIVITIYRALRAFSLSGRTRAASHRSAQKKTRRSGFFIDRRAK